MVQPAIENMGLAKFNQFLKALVEYEREKFGANLDCSFNMTTTQENGPSKENTQPKSKKIKLMDSTPPLEVKKRYSQLNIDGDEWQTDGDARNKEEDVSQATSDEKNNRKLKN